MVDASKYPALAGHVLDALDIRDGSAVYVTGNATQQAFLEEIGIQVVSRGGQPYIQAVTDEYQRRLLETATIEQFKLTPKIQKSAVEACDYYVVIEPYNDPTIKRRFTDKIQARQEGMQPISEILYGDPGKPWVYMGWATEGQAKMYGVPLALLEKLVIGGCDIDYRKLAADCAYVMGALKDARHVRATDRHGTDFRLCIEGRGLIADDGIASSEKIAVGDFGGNLPAGEVFTAPVETYGEGTLYCPLTIDDLTRSTIIKGVRLYFKDGTLLPEKCTAEENQAVLRESLKKSVENDMRKYGAPNALKVAELGIGLNPVIDRAIGYILTDEKIGGSVHVAFGRSSHFGGVVSSLMHWDFVTAPDITLEVEYKDGSKKLLLKEGKLQR